MAPAGVTRERALIALGEPPVIVGGGDGLKFDGNYLTRRDQAVGIGCVIRSTSFENVEIRLDVVNRMACNCKGKCAPCFRCGGLREPPGM